MLPIPVPLIVWFGILGVVVLAAVVTLARSPRKSRKKSKRSSPSVPLKSTYLEAVNGRKGHTATVIFLHGMGQSSQEWKEYAETLNASMPHVRFIFPQAPTIPITILGGKFMFVSCLLAYIDLVASSTLFGEQGNANPVSICCFAGPRCLTR